MRAESQETARRRLRAIVDDCYGDLLAFFRARGFNVENSRDLVQQTLLEALRAEGSFRGDGSFRAWVLGIAKNVYRSELRYRGQDKRAGVHVPLEAIEREDRRSTQAVVVPPAALRQSLDAEQSRLLRQELDRLPPGQRDCLILRIDQDLSYREISKVLQVSIDAVKTRVYAGKATLRKRLGSRFADDL
ncbi:MAG: RNA polymerase sigma factor [Acidobacteriota bacterium]